MSKTLPTGAQGPDSDWLGAFFFLTPDWGHALADFSVPTLDFGGVAADLDFSLFDVSRGGADDGIETTRYDRPRVYDNVLGEVSYEHARDFVDGLDLDVAFASIHTKIVSVETLAGRHVVTDGSANLRSSRNVEQVRVECDDGLYAFVEGFADRVFAAYSDGQPRPTISKARAGQPPVGRDSGLGGSHGIGKRARRGRRPQGPHQGQGALGEAQEAEVEEEKDGYGDAL